MCISWCVVCVLEAVVCSMCLLCQAVAVLATLMGVKPQCTQGMACVRALYVPCFDMFDMFDMEFEGALCHTSIHHHIAMKR